MILSVHLILLLSYSVLLIGVGLWVGRLVRSAGDFFVARRRLGAGLLFSTVLAANIGAGSTVGATGLGYRDGLSAWWWNGSAAIGSLLLALWIGPRIWRAASRHGFFTVGDFLESRYGPTVRGVVAVLIWFATLSILAGQLIGLAWILNVVTGLPKAAGCLVGGVVITTYFAAGGLLGSAWINLVQLVVLAGGFALALPLVLQSAGGLGAVLSGSGMPEGHPTFWVGSTVVSRLALLVPAFIVSPGLLQKAFGARDERAVRVGIGLNAVVLLLFAFVPALLGMAARARYPDLASQELALPTLFMHDLPAGVGALALAAVFSAEISTADAVLFMLATSLSQDIYRRFLRPAATDRQVLGAARVAAVGGGLLGVAIAIGSPTIIDALSLFYALLGVCLFVPVIAGLLTRRAGTPEALVAIAAGVAVDLVVRLATGGRGLGLATPEVCGLAAAAVGFTAVAAGRARLARWTEGTGVNTRIMAIVVAGLMAACSRPSPDASFAGRLLAARAMKDDQFRTAPDSPIPPDKRTQFLPLSYFPPDEDYVASASLAPAGPNERLTAEMPTSTGLTRRMQRVGTLEFMLKGQSLTLAAFVEADAPDPNRLFVPFTDLTSGTETYSAGRYIELERTPTGIYAIDFNRAFNPYCYYNPTYDCPFPPAENRLTVPVRAGERTRALK